MMVRMADWPSAPSAKRRGLAVLMCICDDLARDTLAPIPQLINFLMLFTLPPNITIFIDTIEGDLLQLLSSADTIAKKLCYSCVLCLCFCHGEAGQRPLSRPLPKIGSYLDEEDGERYATGQQQLIDGDGCVT